MGAAGEMNVGIATQRRIFGFGKIQIKVEVSSAPMHAYIHGIFGCWFLAIWENAGEIGVFNTPMHAYIHGVPWELRSEMWGLGI